MIEEGKKKKKTYSRFSLTVTAIGDTSWSASESLALAEIYSASLILFISKTNKKLEEASLTQPEVKRKKVS